MYAVGRGWRTRAQSDVEWRRTAATNPDGVQLMMLTLKRACVPL